MTNIKNFGFWPTQRIILESMNVVRWRPGLALAWMEEVLPKLDTLALTKTWNRAAKKINKEIEDQRKFFYSEEETKYRWAGEIPRKLEEIEEIISLEEFARMSQFSEKK